MRTLSLRIRFGEAAHPMHAFVSDDDRYGPTRLLQWNPTSAGTNLMVFRVAGPREPYLAALDDVDGIRSYEAATHAGGGGLTVLVEDEIGPVSRELIETYADERVVTVPPVVFRTDRSADFRLVGRGDSLSGMVDRLPDDLDAEVRRVGSGGATADTAGDRLTDRQRVVLETALDAGYFAEPREATLDDVARELDLSAGTVAEHVRKAERRLVADALGDRAPRGDGR